MRRSNFNYCLETTNNRREQAIEYCEKRFGDNNKETQYDDIKSNFRHEHQVNTRSTNNDMYTKANAAILVTSKVNFLLKKETKIRHVSVSVYESKSSFVCRSTLLLMLSQFHNSIHTWLSHGIASVFVCLRCGEAYKVACQCNDYYDFCDLFCFTDRTHVYISFHSVC